MNEIQLSASEKKIKHFYEQAEATQIFKLWGTVNIRAIEGGLFAEFIGSNFFAELTEAEFEELKEQSKQTISKEG